MSEVKNVVKKPYFNEEYQMWGVESYNADGGEFSGKSTNWCATEAEAQHAFDVRIGWGFEVVEEVVAHTFVVIEPDGSMHTDDRLEASFHANEIVEGPQPLDMELYVSNVIDVMPYGFLRAIAPILKAGKYDYRLYVEYPGSEVRWLKNEGLLDEAEVITERGREFIRIMG